MSNVSRFLKELKRRRKGVKWEERFKLGMRQTTATQQNMAVWDLVQAVLYV